MEYKITANFSLREMNALVTALEKRQRVLAGEVGNNPRTVEDSVREELGDVADMLARLRGSYAAGR